MSFSPSLPTNTPTAQRLNIHSTYTVQVLIAIKSGAAGPSPPAASRHAATVTMLCYGNW